MFFLIGMRDGGWNVRREYVEGGNEYGEFVEVEGGGEMVGVMDGE